MSTPSKLDGQRYEPIQRHTDGGWDFAPGNIRRWSRGDWVPLVVAQKLERENETLREELEVAKAFHRVAVIERDVARNETKTIAEQYDANEIGAAEVLIHAARLEREIAALRADKARLVEILKRWEKVVDDCHNETRDTGFGEYGVTAGLICDTRAAIDSARKEARP